MTRRERIGLVLSTHGAEDLQEAVEMTVYFTSYVSHANTVEISTERLARYDTRISEADETEGQMEHAIHVPDVGEFSGTDLEEIHKVFRQISGLIGLEVWRQKRNIPSESNPMFRNINDAGNSGTH